jgi:arginine/serine-rich splicing factor 15
MGVEFWFCFSCANLTSLSVQCKPEYKVPGLYVIDSIVRQSRHQFGTDKDVFGPRFSKNITATFQYLYLCPSEDKV